MSTPITAGQLKEAWPVLRLVPDFLVKSSAGNLPEFKVSRIRWVRSRRGREIEGYLILCPMLRRQFSSPDEEFILDKVIAAGHIAERMRCAILGLGGYGSILSLPAYDRIVQTLKIPVTSGNALTAWTVIEVLYRAARIKKIALQGLSAVIVGNHTCIGGLCAVKLSEFGLAVITGSREAFKKADIVINAAASMDELIEVKDLKPGAIFCDVSLFSLTGEAKLRDDITVIEAGLIKLPSGQVISAAMAETMLLTFEQRFVDYSGVGSINPDKLEEIADIAAWHGFEVYAPEFPAL
ncbi:MAG: hypothetical protein ISS32_01370 [Candidatus Omnitrophica bacterium]|nr:hypothetical protein [Candidatus Omnitrophota bacterium]MBL7210417.1 hypothetical protein [Candidatus Omnitrophota bacterium]